MNDSITLSEQGGAKRQNSTLRFDCFASLHFAPRFRSLTARSFVARSLLTDGGSGDETTSVVRDDFHADFLPEIYKSTQRTINLVESMQIFPS